MNGLLDIQDELRLARLSVECAYMACQSMGEMEPIAVVLDTAVDKMKRLGEAIEAIRMGQRD